MADPPELWTFLAVNVVVVVMGGILTALSFTAYRSNGRTTFRNATIGFGLLTIGTTADLFYQAGIKGDYHLSGRELLLLQTTEGVLVAFGLGILFYSIYRYRPGREVEIEETADSIESRSRNPDHTRE